MTAARKSADTTTGWETQVTPKEIVTLGIEWLNEDKRRIRINPDLDLKLEELTQKYLGK